MLLLVKTRPSRLLHLLFVLMKSGRAALKYELSLCVSLDATLLPYNDAVLSYVKSEARQGREVWLVTASPQHYADSIATHLKCFSGTMASSRRQNLKGDKKAQHLLAKFGFKGFDYIGDSNSDIAVWGKAKKSFVVSNSRRLWKRVTAVNSEVTKIETSRPGLVFFLRAIRIQQWPKNLLLLVAFAGAHGLGNGATYTALGLAFVAFCFGASGIYIVNDLLDLQADRNHPWKKTRPFAAGNLSIEFGVGAALLLIALAFSTAFFLPLLFIACLAIYVILAATYSLWLKRVVVLDVFVLTALYLIRVVAGAFAVNVAVSYWLLAFSLFLFLSLASLKRFSELTLTPDALGIPDRGYRSEDRQIVGTLGAASGYIAALVLALYFSSGDAVVLYSQPIFLWLALPALLYWISRLWLLAGRGEQLDDPVAFALHDVVSYVVGALILGATLLAALLPP